MKPIEMLKGVAIAAIAVVVTANTVAAMPITVPSSLSPGDQYRLAFVTSTIHDALSSSIAVYNTFVDDLANLQPELLALGTTWTAIASTPTVDARDNTSTDPGPDATPTGLPIFHLNDTILATDYDDLWDGSIITGFLIAETGNPVPSPGFVWTGSTSSGTVFASRGLGDPSGASWNGRKNSVDGTWINLGGISNAAELPFYAISGILTVPVPEPGTILLFGFGLAGLGYMRRRAAE